MDRTSAIVSVATVRKRFFTVPRLFAHCATALITIETFRFVLGAVSDPRNGFDCQPFWTASHFALEDTPLSCPSCRA